MKTHARCPSLGFVLRTSRRLAFPCALSLASACGGARFERLSPVDLPESVRSGGETIYFGRVFPLEEVAEAPTYVYERRVSVEGDVLVSSHITREPSGGIALAESATHDRAYGLSRYVLHGNQLGQSGEIRVEAGRVVFRLRDGSGEHTEVEAQTGTVVVGPTLVGYIAEHLEVMGKGEVLDVRLALLDRMETLGFELALEEAPVGQTRVRMTASSFFVRLMVDPLHYTFDASTKKLVRLEGRVPPKVRDGDDWADFDARVEYAFVADAYL